MDKNRKDIIIFTGVKQSGKSRAAQYLVGKGYDNTSFAGPLKKMLMAIGLTWEQLYGSEKEIPCALLGGKTPRYAMQTLGTEWGRDMIWRNIWASAWARDIKFNIAANGQLITCDDLRFPNEREVVGELGGTVIRINRPGHVYGADSHESEHHIESLEVDYEINNDGSLSHLYLCMDKILELLSNE